MTWRLLADRDYWPQVCIAASQITFGAFWASIILPLDHYKPYVILLNLGISLFFVVLGSILRRT